MPGEATVTIMDDDEGKFDILFCIHSSHMNMGGRCRPGGNKIVLIGPCDVVQNIICGAHQMPG